jgi:hypothetical protein
MMDKLMISLFLLQSTVTDKVRTRREAGQGTLEYVAALALALIVILALVTAFGTAGTTLSTKVGKIMEHITNIAP